jgi:2-dehydro-3-deoxyphosphogluconate aldolase/(4S)-4-hydroxy-2-oxoglutarate aldolase
MRNDREATLAALRTRKVVAVIRLDGDELVEDAVEALCRGGISCIEITMTVPHAATAIRRVCRNRGLIVGAGTVMSREAVDACADAGAQFIVSPVFLPEVVAHARERGCVAIPGALTPTEVFLAWRFGADMVKIFPAARLGPQFIADLKAPFPEIPLMPTGGITDKTVASYLEVGADAVCAGSWLLDPSVLATRRFDLIEERARMLSESVAKWRPQP